MEAKEFPVLYFLVNEAQEKTFKNQKVDKVIYIIIIFQSNKHVVCLSYCLVVMYYVQGYICLLVLVVTFRDNQETTASYVSIS